ncbi:S8 family serine peptidase [Clostridium sp. SHJSY1]|uniref:S8 family serine peptidase n=1 Tax=Clostridium sp. SHJSY1 TaxID=2942483 RepID=UPI00287402AD|nr:S8 family serine peptidase [Clostridium sp. SHJSY1]MDS0528039.1 S8 family serine peptidase [Clostridium sp. SHJSY1]
MYKRKNFKFNISIAVASLVAVCLFSIPLKAEGATIDNKLKLPMNSSMDKENLMKYNDGEFIVKFKESVNIESSNNKEDKKAKQNKEIEALEVEVLSNKDLGNGLKLVKYKGKKTPKELEKMVKANSSSEIEYIEPNYILTASDIESSWVPKDTYYNNLWGMKNTGQAIQYQNGIPGIDIGAEKAWDITKGSSNVVVAVIDTGVDYTHPDLSNNIWKNTKEIPNNYIDDDQNGYIDDVNGWDFYNSDNSPMDDNGHGTHVSGTIAASGNGAGVIGVAPNVKIMPLKFLNSVGKGYLADVLNAINYANKMGAKISNNSWGGTVYSQALYDAVSNYGGLFIAAAGNLGTDNDSAGTYPASFNLPNIISVASVDNRGSLSSFSNYGASSVDVAAPGEDIYSTEPYNTYGYESGTSMATPHVSGIAALLLSVNPSNTTANIKDSITKSVVKLSNLNGKVATGGMVNAYEAIKKNIPVAMPTNVIATSTGNSSIAINWGAVTGANGYEVYRLGSNGTYGYIANTTSTSFTNIGLNSGTAYSYKIRAYRIVGTVKIYSDFSTVASAQTALAVPLNLTAISANYNSIKVSWGTVTGANGYEVYRLGSSGTYGYIANTTSTSFINTGLNTGTAYSYKVRAYKIIGGIKIYSNFSAAISTKPVLAVPLNLTAVSAGNSSIKISWGAVTGANGYEVYRLGSSGTYGYIANVTSTSFTNIGLSSGTIYSYKIRAYRIVGGIKVYSNFTTVVSTKA